MEDKKPIMAIMYDFDKTLCREDMQNYSFIPAMGMTPSEFWQKTEAFSKKTGVESILSYMYVMVETAKEKGIKMTKEWLRSLGKDISFYEGVLSWFKRINEYGESRNVIVEHYLISSGTKEIIDGCAIAKEFKAIYGCEFLFDEESDLPIWPKYAINYTMKTQYYHRISKGIIDPDDDRGLNEKQLNRRIPYRNMVYLGDGLTDVPCMILCKENGGNSIAVYQKGNKEKVTKIFEDGRVNYIASANYSKGGDLDQIVKLIIDSISIKDELEKKELSLFNKQRQFIKKSEKVNFKKKNNVDILILH